MTRKFDELRSIISNTQQILADPHFAPQLHSAPRLVPVPRRRAPRSVRVVSGPPPQRRIDGGRLLPPAMDPHFLALHPHATTGAMPTHMPAPASSQSALLKAESGALQAKLMEDARAASTQSQRVRMNLLELRRSVAQDAAVVHGTLSGLKDAMKRGAARTKQTEEYASRELAVVKSALASNVRTAEDAERRCAAMQGDMEANTAAIVSVVSKLGEQVVQLRQASTGENGRMAQLEGKLAEVARDVEVARMSQMQSMSDIAKRDREAAMSGSILTQQQRSPSRAAHLPPFMRATATSTTTTTLPPSFNGRASRVRAGAGGGGSPGANVGAVAGVMQAVQPLLDAVPRVVEVKNRFVQVVPPLLLRQVGLDRVTSELHAETVRLEALARMATDDLGALDVALSGRGADLNAAREELSATRQQLAQVQIQAQNASVVKAKAEARMAQAEAQLARSSAAAVVSSSSSSAEATSASSKSGRARVLQDEVASLRQTVAELRTKIGHDAVRLAEVEAEKAGMQRHLNRAEEEELEFRRFHKETERALLFQIQLLQDKLTNAQAQSVGLMGSVAPPAAAFPDLAAAASILAGGGESKETPSQAQRNLNALFSAGGEDETKQASPVGTLGAPPGVRSNRRQGGGRSSAQAASPSAMSMSMLGGGGGEARKTS